MGLFGRSRRSFEIAPGVRMNLSMSGVSYTVGPRWAACEVRAGRRGRGNSGAARNGSLGCLGIAGLLFIGFCSTILNDAPDSARQSPGSPRYAAGQETPPPRASAGLDTLYVHGPLNVRTGPGKEHPVVRTLSRGELVLLGPKDANGWAELFLFGGTREGYVFRASDLVRTTPPPVEPAPRATPASGRSTGSGSTGRRRSSAESRGYYLGPRGGCYTYSSSGRKRYVDRSYCN